MKTLACFVVLALVGLVHLHPVDDEALVETKVGKFRGYRNKIEGHEINVFKGIRYAKAPTGERRFHRPELYKYDNDDYHNATQYGYACHQYMRLANEDYDEHEDCLHLNVWTPATTKTAAKKMPVMFWIHGGGFVAGTASADTYRGDYLAAFGEVVVVTINYRLGPFGFMYGGNKDEPGNLGLYDQLLALQWVNDHIEAFGGDASQITIFGESAGSASVTGHIISPLTKGLFKRGISESGALYGKDTGITAEEAERHTLHFAKELKCLKHDDDQKLTKEIMDCLRHKDVREMKKLNVGMMDARLVYETGFDNEFFPKNPFQAMKKGDFNTDIDYLFGVNDDEGAVILMKLFPNDFDPDHHTMMDLKKAEMYIRMMMQYAGRADKADDAVKFYMRHANETDEDSLLEAVSQAFGDMGMVCPAIQFGHQLAYQTKNAHAYCYRMTRKANVFRDIFRCRGWTGVCHGEEIAFVFGWPYYHYYDDKAYTEDDKKFSKHMIDAWTTFARTGKMPKMGEMNWDEALKEKKDSAPVQYMELNYDNYRMVQDRYTENCDRFFKA